MIDETDKLIGFTAQLSNGGAGLLFSVWEGEQKVPAFAIRFNNVVRAFKNRCGHIAVNLDMNPGHFFTEEQDFLVCSTHGALYDPETGACQGGPCYGVGLEPLLVVEQDGAIYLADSSVILVKETE